MSLFFMSLRLSKFVRLLKLSFELTEDVMRIRVVGILHNFQVASNDLNEKALYEIFGFSVFHTSTRMTPLPQ
jgi:hypothetical protein